ncbi:MAG: DUF3471 domain-containing protein [Opitutus sp.]|nr:DUF3471 domain-containing protein [Opitutus sp.]
MSSTPGPMRHFLLGAIIVGGVAVATAQENIATLPTQIDELLAQSYPADAPGAAVIVVRHGEVLLRQGYGLAHVELGVPVKPEHVFRLGSITKQFTAVAILQLVETGKIKLDDDITTYVPEVQTGGHKITLTHLLTHTSGLPSYTETKAFHTSTHQEVTLAQTLAWIRNQPAHFTPGADWLYCNTGFRLLGAVIEKVSGQSYADYVAAKIFQPAGMMHSSYDQTDRIIPQRIPGYTAKGGRTANADFIAMTQPHAAGALVSNVDDLWKWEQALAAGTLVSPAMLAPATTSARLIDGRATGYGFGWSVGTISGHPSVEHGGGIQGFSTYELRAPDAGLYVAVLCNSDKPRAAPSIIATRIASLVLGKPAAIGTVTVPPETLRGYVGVYRVTPSQKIAFAIEGGRFVHQDGRGRSTPLDALSPTEFTGPGRDVRFTFTSDTASRVTRVLTHPRTGLEKYGVRVEEPLADPVKPAVAVAAGILDQYVGAYQLAPNFILTVRRDGASLAAQATGQPEFNLIAESATRFRVKQAPAAIEFKTAADGGAPSLVLFQNGREVPGKKIK